jgi:hypothetical protein
LSVMTQDLRAERGYGRSHPILVQTGEMKDATAGTLSAWSIGTGRALASGTGIRMSAWTGQLQFTARASGPKMKNQIGGQTEFTYYPEGNQKGGSSSDLPARPFFGLTQAGTIQARDAITNKIMTDWSHHSSKTRRKK